MARNRRADGLRRLERADEAAPPAAEGTSPSRPAPLWPDGRPARRSSDAIQERDHLVHHPFRIVSRRSNRSSARPSTTPHVNRHQDHPSTASAPKLAAPRSADPGPPTPASRWRCWWSSRRASTKRKQHRVGATAWKAAGIHVVLRAPQPEDPLQALPGRAPGARRHRPLRARRHRQLQTASTSAGLHRLRPVSRRGRPCSTK